MNDKKQEEEREAEQDKAMDKLAQEARLESLRRFGRKRLGLDIVKEGMVIEKKHEKRNPLSKFI